MTESPSYPIIRRSVGIKAVFILVVGLLATWLLPVGKPIYPVLVALAGILLLRHALAGLLLGALFGAILVGGASPLSWPSVIWSLQLRPIFDSSWRLSALFFTLILGGFVALLEEAGGLRDLIRRLLREGYRAGRRMQFIAMGSGVLIFFDGLANTMLVGRLFRRAADRCGVSRAKLAYIADSTGSSVACVSAISTWIVFQLAMIQEGFQAAGVQASRGVYSLFFLSIPFNFYCLFTLALLGLGIYFRFNPGPMGRHEQEARARLATDRSPLVSPDQDAPWYAAVLPIVVLIAAVPFLIYAFGSDSKLFPFSVVRFADAYENIENYVPHILVAASVAGAFVAWVTYWIYQRNRPETEQKSASRVFGRGVAELAVPVLVLIAAWMLGAASRELGAGDWITGALSGQLSPVWLPASIFVVGAIVSFCTGTSWGTMAILMPLAIPVVYGIVPLDSDPSQSAFVIVAIGAVFSGAVFGDHCSPFSDTTIVSSVAAGVDPLVHVSTQLPFALLAAAAALIFGFMPFSFGFPVTWSLIAGIFALGLICWHWRFRSREVR